MRFVKRMLSFFYKNAELYNLIDSAVSDKLHFGIMLPNIH